MTFNVTYHSLLGTAHHSKYLLVKTSYHKSSNTIQTNSL